MICTNCGSPWPKTGRECPTCHSRQYGQYVPTPEDIRAGCEEIQAGWTDYERWARDASRPEPLEVRLAHVASVQNRRIVRYEMREA